MIKEELIWKVIGLPNFKELTKEDNDVQTKLISSGISKEEIITYFEVKKECLIKNKEKVDNAILLFSTAVPFILGGFTIASDYKMLSFGVASTLIIGGAYTLVKENKYATKFKDLNKQYQVKSNIGKSTR